MKKLILAILCLSSLVFFGCSGKVQTNKIPNDKKYHLPKKVQNSTEEYPMDSKVVQSYSVALEEFFKTKKADEDAPVVLDIYQVGLDRGYFNE